MPKPKRLAGKDTFTSLLIHHWARDESIYRTEDDRLDTAAITLFLTYTGLDPPNLSTSREALQAKILLARRRPLILGTLDRPNSLIWLLGTVPSSRMIVT
jgi:hypothetical protein